MKYRHFHFLILILILTIGVIALFATIGNRGLQLAISLAMAVAYIFWGAIHHYREKNLHIRIMVEYILIAAIAVMLIITMLV